MQQATNESDLEKTTSFLKKRKKELEEKLASFNNEEALNTDLICQQAVDSWTAELEVIIEVLEKFSNNDIDKNHYPVYGATDLRLLTEIKMQTVCRPPNIEELLK